MSNSFARGGGYSDVVNSSNDRFVSYSGTEPTQWKKPATTPKLKRVLSEAQLQALARGRAVRAANKANRVPGEKPAARKAKNSSNKNQQESVQPPQNPASTPQSRLDALRNLLATL